MRKGQEVKRVGAVQISTDLSPIERRVGLACKIAKLKTGGIGSGFKHNNVISSKKSK